MIVSLRTTGPGISERVVRGALIGLVQSVPEKFGKCLKFHVSRFWVRSSYQRMTFSRQAAIISRPVITRSLWIETKSQLLHDISDKVLLYTISDKLIINADQTPSKYVATDNDVTMVAKGEKHISWTGSNDKRPATFLSSLFLKKKRQDCYQMLVFLSGFPFCTMKNARATKLRPFGY